MDTSKGTLELLDSATNVVPLNPVTWQNGDTELSTTPVSLLNAGEIYTIQLTDFENLSSGCPQTPNPMTQEFTTRSLSPCGGIIGDYHESNDSATDTTGIYEETTLVGGIADGPFLINGCIADREHTYDGSQYDWDVDTFQFSLTEDAGLTIDVAGYGANPFNEDITILFFTDIYDGYIANGTASGGTGTSVVVSSGLPAGDYYVMVIGRKLSAYPSYTGHWGYTVTINLDSPIFPCDEPNNGSYTETESGCGTNDYYTRTPTSINPGSGTLENSGLMISPNNVYTLKVSPQLVALKT